VLIIRFAGHMITENAQVVWAEMQRGEFITDALVAAGTYRTQGVRWMVANGGVCPRRGRDLKGRCLSFAEWEEIGLACAAGDSIRAIAARLGRSPSTISRELARNRESGGGCRASSAHATAYHRASRPKPAKLAVNLALRAKVEQDLQKKYSPEQITSRLRVEFPDDPEMWVSPETIYQSIYVQSPGRLAPRSGGVSAHRAGDSSTEPQGRATQESHPGHDQHRRTSTRGRGPRGARVIGRAT